jgi:CRP-like cAMP-binding protein
MMSVGEFQEILTQLKLTNTKINSVSETNIHENEIRIFQTFSDFLGTKFFETSKIFQKFDFTSMINFCKESKFEQYTENQKIFSKGEECDCYYFILYGDINLYEEEFANSNENTQIKLMKTMSAGSVYGHKIKSTFNFFAVAKNSTSLLKIHKTVFDKIIEETNKRKDQYKLDFLKKFFPKLRMYSDEVLNSLRNFFIREEYYKGGKIFNDSEYDEYIYLVINGSLGVAKSVRKIKNFKDKFSTHGRRVYNSLNSSSNQELSLTLNDSLACNANSVDNLKYVILDKFTRGDVFGAYSALKHQKNNYTVIVLSERTQVYKISKAHCLYYFGGSSGIIPEALRGTDSAQQTSLNYKLDFLEKCEDTESIYRFTYLNEENENTIQAHKPIDESVIENNLKNAWKELENLGSKITQFKDNLLNKTTPGLFNKPNDIFAKPKTNTSDVECIFINFNIFYL